MGWGRRFRVTVEGERHYGVQDFVTCKRKKEVVFE